MSKSNTEQINSVQTIAFQYSTVECSVSQCETLGASVPGTALNPAITRVKRELYNCIQLNAQEENKH